MATQAQRSIRLTGKTTTQLNQSTGSAGEIFYDTTNQTLRIYTSNTAHLMLATRPWVIANTFNGDYNSLTNRPAGFNGDYSSLTNKPVIFNGSYVYLTNKPNLNAYATKTDLSSAIANIPVVDLTGLATESYVGVAISNLVDTAPTTLNTLNELAAALNDDANFASTVTTALSAKAAIASPTFTGTVTIPAGASISGYVTSSGGTLSNVNGLGFASGVVVNGFSDDDTFADNASDKVPVQSAVKTYVDTGLALKAPINNPTFTGTVGGVYPTQTGNTGKYLTTNGTAVSWATVAGGGGTTTNPLTFSTGLSLNSGTTFDGSAAKTVSLATSGASSGTYGDSYSSGSFIYMPQFTVDAYGRITSVTTNYVGVGGGTSLPSQFGNSGKYLTTDGTSLSWATVATSGGGITWATNSMSSGDITVTNPTGYSTSGSTMVIVVVGSGTYSSSASSGFGSFSSAPSVGSSTKVYYTYTTSSLNATTTISGISGYAMAYAYIGSGPSISTNSGSSTSMSASVMNPSPVSGTPRIIAVSTASMLNLSTAAGAAAGGGPTWANGSGFAHPNDSNLSAAVWVGTGSWTSSATVLVNSNQFNMSWYLTGITVG